MILYSAVCTHLSCVMSSTHDKCEWAKRRYNNRKEERERLGTNNIKEREKKKDREVPLNKTRSSVLGYYYDNNQ